MLSKSRIKYIQSLKLKKFRQKYNNFTVEGDKIAREILTATNCEIEAVFATASWIETNKALLSSHFSKTLTVEQKDLKKISSLSTPNEAFIIAKQLNYSIDTSIVQQDFSLYLDGIQDPGNMGTILRIADWFGIPYVFCSKTCVDIYNTKVIQATMGAFLRVKICTIDFQALQQMVNIPVYGMVLDGSNLYKQSFGEAGILVIGNESKGISSTVKMLISHKVTIPSAKNGGAESLNAGVATGIICAHIRNKS